LSLTPSQGLLFLNYDLSHFFASHLKIATKNFIHIISKNLVEMFYSKFPNCYQNVLFELSQALKKSLHFYSSFLAND
jgi:hypothetical protein